ncbi:hypothetical protein L917_19027, partial [Phytophthora nicotianae]
RVPFGQLQRTSRSRSPLYRRGQLFQGKSSGKSPVAPGLTGPAD